VTTRSTATSPATSPGSRRAPAQTRTEFVDEPRPRWVAFGLWVARLFSGLRARLASAWATLASVVTPAGWLVGLWAVLGLAVGLVLGWGEFLIGAAVALVLVVLATPFLLGKEAYEVEFSLEHDAVVAGHTAHGEIVVRSPKARLALPGRIDIPVGDGLVDFHVPLLRRGHQHTERIVIPARRRGVVDVGPATTTRSDPLNLLHREFHWADVKTLYIHPVTIALPSTSRGFIRDLEGIATRTVTTEDISFHAVREYANGDAQRHIHWKSTAKVGRLMVRQFDETRRSTICLVLDLDESSYASPEEFEIAVSVIGSLGVRALRDGRDVRAVVSGDVPQFAKASVRALRELRVSTPRGLLDDLSGVESGSAVADLPAITRMVAEAHVDTSLVFLATGSAAPLSRLQSAGLAFGPEIAVAAVVCDPAAEPSLHALGHSRVLTVGLLDDLRQLLAKGARA
jgi:uncharacterized protein (DUF58 family)